MAWHLAHRRQNRSGKLAVAGGTTGRQRDDLIDHQVALIRVRLSGEGHGDYPQNMDLPGNNIRATGKRMHPTCCARSNRCGMAEAVVNHNSTTSARLSCGGSAEGERSRVPVPA